jgi:hypothetical protein
MPNKLILVTFVGEPAQIKALVKNRVLIPRRIRGQVLFQVSDIEKVWRRVIALENTVNEIRHTLDEERNT